MTGTAGPAIELARMVQRHAQAVGRHAGYHEKNDSLADVPRLVAAVEAVLEQADDLTQKSEALDAEAEYIAGEHPEAAAVAVLRRERSIAYDECARWFREAITSALTGEAP